MRAGGGSIRRLPYVVQVSLLAAVYFAAAKASLLLAIPPGYASVVWPPAGIALAAVLLLGSRVWPGVWLGAALANLTVASSPLAALMIASGNTLEACAAAALVRRHVADAPPFFDRVRDVGLFVAFAAACATLAATIGVGALVLTGSIRGAEFAANLGTWWVGDTAGNIIVAPLVLTWSMQHHVVWTRPKLLEIAGFGASLSLVSVLVFGQSNGYLVPLPLTFLILPFIVWAAFRFSRREVTTAIAVVCTIAIWQSVAGDGPFARGPLNQSLLLLLAFISCVVATGLMLSAAVGERDRTRASLERVLQEVREQARSDPLTGLANRRSLEEFLHRTWVRAQRDAGTLAVVMMDLDHFKSVNDRFGHDAGDRVLMSVAQLLKSHIRAGDMACRFGGEEFAIVMPEATLDVVRGRAENIRRAIRQLEPRYRSRPLGRISASFGIALYPLHAEDPERLLRAADGALYDAKAAGRDRIVVAPEGERTPL